MSIVNVPTNIKKVDRDDALCTFLDTTPAGAERTWAVLGIGITDYGIAFNPQVDTEKWIIEKNARTDHSSNQKQGDVTQKIHKNDPCYTFVKAGMDKMNYKTNILDIFPSEGNNGTYPAKMSEGKITITNFGGENGEIEYTLYYEGDATEGTVTVSDGVPSFSPSASL